MRAIIIDAEERTVSETEIDGRLHTLQKIVGGLIDPVYPGLEGTGHHCYVNDEGLLNNPQHFFMLKDGHQPLAGNGVILGDDNGNEAPCTLPLDWVKERVTFMDRGAVLEWIGKDAERWIAKEPHQEVMRSLIGEPEIPDNTAKEKAVNEPPEQPEITDAKAAKKEALAEVRAEIEQSVAEAHDLGKGNSR